MQLAAERVGVREAREALGASPAVLGLAVQAAGLSAAPAQARLAHHARQLDRGVALQRKAAPPARPDGLPAGIRMGVEAASGLGMDDVRVHYNSSRPAQLRAHAYTQGSDIHVAPGQERHLAHEAWHVVQQKQGRVRPTLQLRGVDVNDDGGLEREADDMAGRIETAPVEGESTTLQRVATAGVVQARFTMAGRHFDYGKSLVRLNEELDKKSKDSFVQENRAAILAQIQAWSESEVDERGGTLGEKNPTSYDDLIGAARRAVAARLFADRPIDAVRSADLLPLGDDTDSETDESEDEDTRLGELGGLRRTASFEVSNLADFRDRSQMARLTSNDTGASYTIGANSNFMLGGGMGSGLPDDYATIIEQLRGIYGSDQRVAQMLYGVLNGGGLPRPPARGLAEKFRSLILGPELRRAAINPVAAEAALLRVAERGGDLFAELRRGALFVASENDAGLGKGQGGSARSQYHRREEIDRTKPDFRSTAMREKQNIERAARRHGMAHDVNGFVAMRSRRIAAIWRATYGPRAAEPMQDEAEDSSGLEQIVKKVRVEGADSNVNMLREETSPSGNCLYEGVNIALGNPADMDGVLREFATQWFVDHPGFAADTGIDADRIVEMLSQNGAWAGDAGDIAPYVLASAIRRNIIVRTPEVTHVIEAREAAGDPVVLYLTGNHYTVAPPEGVDFSDSTNVIKGPGK